MHLNQRDTEILTTIIEHYIQTAAPVASRMVAKKSRTGLSPASIRNIMADLTEQGLLEQPHTSAGRMPTAGAFRFYIDSVLKLPPLPEEEKTRIASMLSGHGADVSDLLRRAGKLLSRQSRQVSMVLAPRYSQVRWKRIEFVLVRDRLALVVLVMQGDIIQQRLVELEEDVTRDDLVKYANYLNELFEDKTVFQARAEILRQLQGTRRQLSGLCRRALEMADRTFGREAEQELFVEGRANILNRAEFSDITSMHELLYALEERERLLRLLDRVMENDGLRITLGAESSPEQLGEVSLISTPYSLQGEPLGIVGVIGPLRMDYAKVAPVVDYMGHVLTAMLQKRI